MIGKKKAALILSMVLASSLYGVAGAAEVQAPVWLMDNQNDPVVFDGDKPTIVFNGEDPEHANGALNLTATNKTITTQNGAPLTIKVEPGASANAETYTAIYAENTNNPNAYGGDPITPESFADTIDADLDLQVRSGNRPAEFLAAASGITLMNRGLRGEGTVHTDQTLVVNGKTDINLVNAYEPAKKDQMKSDGSGILMFGTENNSVILDQKGDFTVNAKAESDNGKVTGLFMDIEDEGTGKATFGKNFTANVTAKKYAARGIDVYTNNKAVTEVSVAGAVNITAKSDSNMTYGIEAIVGVPMTRTVDGQKEPVADPTRYTMKLDGPVNISVSSGNLPEGADVNAGPVSEQTGVLVMTRNGSTAENTFNGPVSVRAKGPNEASGLIATAFGGSHNTFTLNNTVTVTAEGKAPAKVRGVEAGSNDGADVKILMNKGADITATNRALTVSTILGDKPGASAEITVKGGPVNLSSTLADDSNSLQDEGDGAVISQGENAVANINLDGGNKVTIKGDVTAKDGGVLNLKLDTHDSELNGNIVAIDGGKANVTVDNAFINGSAYDGFGMDGEGAADLKLKDAVWNVGSTSTLSSLTADGSLVNLSSAQGPGNGDDYQVLDLKDLKGGNSSFLVDLDPSRNKENADQINVAGDFEGEHLLALRLTAEGDVAPAKGTVLAKVKNNNGKFLVEDQEDPLVWKHFALGTRPAENDPSNPDLYSTEWYLAESRLEDPTVRPTTIVSTLQSAHALTYGTWRNQLGDSKLLQRLGELHQLEAGDDGVWFRTKNGTAKNTGVFNYRNKFHEYELGYDRPVDTADGRRYLGVSVSWDKGDADFIHGGAEVKGLGLSLYRTDIRKDGSYLDTVLKAHQYKNDFHGVDAREDAFTGKLKNRALSISGEYGKRFGLEKGLFVEPQAQLTLGTMSGRDYHTSSGIHVDNGRMYSAIGRLGVNAGMKLDARSRVYAKVNLLHEFAGSYDNRLTLDGMSVKADNDYRDTWVQYGAGINWNPTANSQLYVDLEKTSGGDFTSNWTWNAGMNWRF